MKLWLSFIFTCMLGKLAVPVAAKSQSQKNTANLRGLAATSCPSFAGYVFWPGYDSPQNDIGRYDPASVTLASMISSCSANANCKGLTTSGYYKSYIKPLRSWSTWTTTLPCQGLYIKTPTSFKVNGNALDTKEITYLKWIAQWTVPNFGMSRFNAIRDYIAKGTWWSLKEQVLMLTNAYNFTLCNLPPDQVIGPLAACTAGRAWQVGIAAVQVPNYQLTSVEQRATAVYQQNVSTVLGRSAQQAGYTPGTATYNAITQATGDVRKAWLLKAHLVGFYFVADEVNNECLISTPQSWCYGTYGNTCTRCARYSPDATKIQSCIDDVMVLLQSLTNGTSV